MGKDFAAAARRIQRAFPDAREASPKDTEARRLRIRLQLLQADAAALQAEAEKLADDLQAFAQGVRGLRSVPLDEIEMYAEAVRDWIVPHGQGLLEFDAVPMLTFLPPRIRKAIGTQSNLYAALRELEKQGLIEKMRGRGHRYRLIHREGGEK